MKKKKRGGGNKTPIASTEGEVANKDFLTDIPYIKKDLTGYKKEDIEELKNKNIEKIKRAEVDLVEARRVYDIEKDKKEKEKENDKKLKQKYYGNDIKKDIANDKNRLQILIYIFNTIGVFLKSIYDFIIIRIFPKAFSALGTVTEKGVEGAQSGAKIFFTNIINGPLFVKIIIPTIIIIAVILFIFYLIGFKLNIGSTSPGSNIGSVTIPDINNDRPNSGIAESKPIYTKNDSYFDKLINFIMTSTGIKNIVAFIKLTFFKLNKNIGNYDNLDEYSIKRNIITTGRNDDIYNMKLSKYFGKTDKDVYSIFIPASMEIKYEDVKDKLLDFNKLPDSIKVDILKNKEIIKLNWDLENNKFILRCNNNKDLSNKSINLYGDCSKKIKFENVLYDSTRERYIYNYLDGLKSL